MGRVLILCRIDSQSFGPKHLGRVATQKKTAPPQVLISNQHLFCEVICSKQKKDQFQTQLQKKNIFSALLVE